jgi:protein-arginine kinase activator protein McsA
MIEKINQKNLEFQEALVNQNHKKALEIRDEYLNLKEF